jgi:hypothetical protein
MDDASTVPPFIAEIDDILSSKKPCTALDLIRITYEARDHSLSRWDDIGCESLRKTMQDSIRDTYDRYLYNAYRLLVNAKSPNETININLK